jgi:hypothetical protein
MTEFWDKPAEKSGKVLEAFLEGLPLVTIIQRIFGISATAYDQYLLKLI